MRLMMTALCMLAACGGDGPNEPTTPIAVSALTGTYTIELTKVLGAGIQFNQNDSCQRVSVTFGASPSWAVVSCLNSDIRAAGVELKADSVILNVQPVQFRAMRAYRFGGFTGTTDRAHAEWMGGTCVDTTISNVCMRESGTAIWRR